MKILDTKVLAKASKGNKTFLTLHERTVEHNNHQFPYFFVSRGEKAPLHTHKRPDAVIIVAVTEDGPNHWASYEPRLVLTSEFRVPLGCREMGFPAGIIDPDDFDSSFSEGAVVMREAAVSAAVRELKEETGMDLHVTEVSPPNLYSSAGMTNESITIVFGKATGTPSTEGNETGEDIEVILATLPELINMMDDNQLEWGKTSWPFLWAFKRSGSFLF